MKKLTTYNIEWDGIIENVNAKTFNKMLSYCYKNNYEMELVEEKHLLTTKAFKNGELIYTFYHKI